MTDRPRRPAGRAARPGAADSESILFRLQPFESVRQSVSDYSVSLSSLESSDFSIRDLKSCLGPSAQAEVSDFLLILQDDHKNQCIMCIFFGPAWVPISKVLSVFKFKLGTEKRNVQN